jgi:hypothetical protein
MPGPLGRGPENQVFTSKRFGELVDGSSIIYFLLSGDAALVGRLFLRRKPGPLRLLADISFAVLIKELKYYV